MAHKNPSMRIDALIPWAQNARTHSPKQIRQLARSIQTFGFTNPVLVDERGTILAGHGRVEAARSLGLTEVPYRRLDHMTEDQKRAYVLADNKLAENAGWDNALLAIELGALLSADLDFDLGVIGFDPGDIDVIIEGEVPAETTPPEDEVLPACEKAVVTRVGDLWQLGDHRLICGDARQGSVLEALMPDELAQMVFCDPPYNVPVHGHICGTGATRHREFAMASGEMSRDQFTSFLNEAFDQLRKKSLEGSIHFICMDWRHIGEILQAGEAAYSELKNLIVWAKDNGGMGSFYRSRHELIFVYKAGTAPHINTFGLGQGGRYRTNVWEYRGANSGGAARLEELAMHPTVKPVAMIADAMRDCSHRGGIVLDAFGGSGSTLIAAQRTGRRARLVEIDPVYVDRTIRRWQALAHDDAVLVATGETFEARNLRLTEQDHEWAEPVAASDSAVTS
ncbi:DNA methyltransferase [Sulfitobacter sp. SK011]|uniref:site-specific DNA-methyltransferase n=1 Tax=Sulfitobacter sp. SK011 TaxID=1389004 RepID=UPI000E0B05A5|nr:DNA methyltransferase [Sulfitobacter sp. SK011]AXI43282.1 DNA methylase N-4 [Sulfitobacter sp. SK011]